MTEKQIIQYCCLKVEETFGHGSSEEWSHSHFVLLSQNIEKETGLILSTTTLKRLFGKRSTDSEYIPQLATRNALAKFVGFEGWNGLSKVAQTENNDGSKTNAFRFLKHNKISSRLLIVIILVLGTFGSFVFYFLDKHTHDIPEIDVSIRKKVDTIPFTAIFDYILPDNIRDTFYLKLPGLGYVPLSEDKNLLTHWFNYAGLYRIPVLYGQTVVDTIEILAQNRYWQPGLYQDDLIAPFKPFYNSTIDPTEDDYLYLSPFTLQNNGIDSLSNYMSEFRLFRPFHVSLDTCLFLIEARNNYQTGGKPCFDIDIELVGENGLVRSVFTQEKCSRFVQLVICEKAYDGRDHDLSMLSVDVNHWNLFGIHIKSGKAMIMINDRIVFEQNYVGPIGNLQGIIIRFFGSGQARKIELYNGEDNIRFSDNFK